MKGSGRKFNRLFNILLFSGLGCFSYLFLVLYADIPEGHQHVLTSPEAVLAVVVMFNVLGESIMYINNRVRNAYPAFLRERKKIVLYSVLVALLLLGLNCFLLASVKWIIDLPNPFEIKWSGVRMLLVIWLVELIVVSQIMVNNFYRHLILLYKRTSELEESSVKAQYQALQNQLNPHFLFNSLNTLISEIEYNPANAALFTRHLSDVYRYILQCQEQPLVTLGSELEFLHSYIFLHQVRLGNCIQIDNRIDPAYFNRRVPPLTLQLLAENVIKHNAISQSKPMVLELTLEDDCLVVSNVIKPKKGGVLSGKGLTNLTSRYRLLCGRDITVVNDGQCFTVKVPLLYE